MLQRLPTILSVTALVVAVLGVTPLGEAAYNAVVPRNSVGTLQLKRNAVTSSKLAPNAVRTGQVVDGSLLTTDFKPGQIPQGPKGDKGDKGDKGSAGPPGLAALEVVDAVGVSNSVDTKSLRVSCPTGKVAVGGGGATTNGAGALTAIIQSSPVSEGTTSQWMAVAREMTPTTGSWQVVAYAVCAKVNP